MKTGKNRKITIFASSFGVFLLAMLTAVMIFTSLSNQYSTNTAFRTLHDSTDTISASLLNRLSDQYTVLESYSLLLSSKKNFDTDSTRRDMTAVAETANFVSLSIALPDGSAFSQSEERFIVSDFAWFQKALNGSNTVEKIYSEGDNPGYFILSVPVYKDETVAAVLSAKLPDTAIMGLFTASAYDGKSELFVTDTDGCIIIGSTGEYYNENTNIVDMMSASRILDGADADKLAENLANGVSDTVIFEYGGLKQYAIFLPLGIEGWTVFNVVSGETVVAESDTFNRNIYGLAASAVIFTILLAVVLISRESKYSNQLRNEADSLRQSEQRYRVVEEFSEGVIFEGDLLTDELHFNANYQKIFNHPPFLKTASDFGVIQPMIFVDDAMDFAEFGQKMLRGDPPGGNIEYRVCGISGQPVWHRLEYRTITHSNGRPAKIIGRVQNIDTEKTRLLKLQIMAESDSLTGLCNNLSFKEKVDHYLQNDGLGGEHFLMVIDLDDFKSVNDTFGHAEGDRILQLFSAKIKPLFRTSDIIGRIGGDEFAIFVKDFSQIKGISSKAQDICELVSILGGSLNEFTLTSSIGISIYKRDGTNFLELFKKADTALYQAKRIGKGRFSIYDPTLNIIGARK